MTDVDELAPLAEPDLTPIVTNPTPCVIHLNAGGVCTVEDVDSWAYLDEWGIFAAGKMGHSEKPGDYVFPWSSIAYISLDFAALDRYLDAPEPEDVG